MPGATSKRLASRVIIFIHARPLLNPEYVERSRRVSETSARLLATAPRGLFSGSIERAECAHQRG